MNQPGKVANPARGQLNNRENEYSPVPVRGSSERVLPWQVTMDQLICASISHTIYAQAISTRARAQAFFDDAIRLPCSQRIYQTLLALSDFSYNNSANDRLVWLVVLGEVQLQQYYIYS